MTRSDLVMFLVRRNEWPVEASLRPYVPTPFERLFELVHGGGEPSSPPDRALTPGVVYVTPPSGGDAA